MEKILVIEDNTDIRENISEILSLSGFQAILSESGAAGLQAVKSERPDLVLCDIGLPDINGFDLFLKIKSCSSQVPFIFLTGSTDINDRCKGLDFGADDFIVKPFSEMELLSSIRCRIKKSHQLKESLEKEKLLYIRELEDIAFLISHSVRSPLCSSLGLAELLRSKSSDDLTTRELKIILDGITSSTLKIEGTTAHLSSEIDKLLRKRKI